MTDRIRESKVEKKGNAYAESRGWMVMKFVSPGTRAVADRIYIREKAGPQYMGLGPKRTVFIEWKAPGEEPTPQQYKRGRDIIAHGAEWYWADCLEDVIEILR